MARKIRRVSNGWIRKEALGYYIVTFREFPRFERENNWEARRFICRHSMQMKVWYTTQYLFSSALPLCPLSLSLYPWFVTVLLPPSWLTLCGLKLKSLCYDWTNCCTASSSYSSSNVSHLQIFLWDVIWFCWNLVSVDCLKGVESISWVGVMRWMERREAREQHRLFRLSSTPQASRMDSIDDHINDLVERIENTTGKWTRSGRKGRDSSVWLYKAWQ